MPFHPALEGAIIVAQCSEYHQVWNGLAVNEGKSSYWTIHVNRERLTTTLLG